MTQLHIRTIDLPSLHRHAIGFDRLFQELDRVFSNNRADDKYPPHNVIQLDETHFLIEIAIAGFKENEIDVELKDNILTIRGQQAKEEDVPEVTYLHKGISARNFERNFPLLENVEVRGATVKNGILSIALEQILPEENPPKKIAISFAK